MHALILILRTKIYHLNIVNLEKQFLGYFFMYRTGATVTCWSCAKYAAQSGNRSNKYKSSIKETKALMKQRLQGGDIAFCRRRRYALGAAKDSNNKWGRYTIHGFVTIFRPG
jgi:hypothetical protein